jgi:hypothetical protein
MKWSPDKIIAASLILVIGALIALGIDGELKAAIGAAAGYFFGASYTSARKK